MGNIHISGSGKVSAEGNYYEDVHISGSGRIDGNLRCRSIHVSGSGHFNGNAVCEEEIRISGSGHFEKSVECGSFSVSGSGHIENDLKCKDFKSSGSSHIKGSVSCTDAAISGSVQVEKDMTGENIRISGGSSIHGLLNAENITIMLYGKNTVGEIGCTKLDVGISKNNSGSLRIGPFSFGSKNKGDLVCPIIEGDEVNLVNTTSNVVRGKNVRIGPDCVIKRVEYSESIEVDSSSTVGEQVKI